MKKLLYLPMILLMVFIISGCKLPGSVFDGLDDIIYYAEEADEVCSPLLDQIIEQLAAQIQEMEDSDDKEACEKFLNRLVEVRSNLPKITRNLKQLKKLLEAYNGVSEAISEELNDILPESKSDSPEAA